MRRLLRGPGARAASSARMDWLITGLIAAGVTAAGLALLALVIWAGASATR